MKTKLEFIFLIQETKQNVQLHTLLFIVLVRMYNYRYYRLCH